MKLLRHFGLDHPELSQVTDRVRVLSTEGRAEGVHITQGAAVGFDIELAGDGHLHVLAEEVLGVVDLAVLGLGNVLLCMRRR